MTALSQAESKNIIRIVMLKITLAKCQTGSIGAAKEVKKNVHGQLGGIGPGFFFLGEVFV
jgi:hypothetical protein